MLGDNRDNSTDSRILSQMGYIPLENIIGRAGLIYFSRSSTGAIRTARTRAILVTNWSVHSASARELVSDLFARQTADCRAGAAATSARLAPRRWLKPI